MNKTEAIPVEPNELKQRPKWAKDAAASKEERKWGTDALENRKITNDMLWLTVYGWILCVITSVFALIFLAALLSWAWHYLSPEYFQWLDAPQLNKIQSVLFSGGMGAVVSGIVRAQIGKTK